MPVTRSSIAGQKVWSYSKPLYHFTLLRVTDPRSVKIADYPIFRVANTLCKLLYDIGMPTVAEQLQQAREAQKLTTEDVADYTKIRIDHVRALDEGNYDVFSAPVYIRGFVKAYAGMLKLDVPTLLAQLNEELSGNSQHKDPPLLSRSRNGVLDGAMYQLSKLNWRMLLGAVVGGLILITGFVSYALYKNWADKSHQVTVGDTRVHPTTTGTGESLPLPPVKR